MKAMKKNDQEIGNPFTPARTPFLKRTWKNIKIAYKKQFTSEQIAEAIGAVICLYCALKFSNIWVPLRDFLNANGETVLKAFLIYVFLNPIAYILIRLSISLMISIKTLAIYLLYHLIRLMRK
ncbi:hypothetical protein ACQ4M4_24335 [Leptolyngbya sp. AN02str]|uniref:hypothetical protein n=1 Tax=Leptolyngbya sp. AN02str TaxID=3423363 RepID=UPI003D311C5A